MSEDFSEKTVPIKLKTLYSIIALTIICTGSVLAGWYAMNAKANDAMTVANNAMAQGEHISKQLLEVKCLLRQQNFYQMYKTIPSYSCEKGL